MATWTGSSPIKFNNPVISGENGKTYRIDITLADANGCKSSKYTYYVKQMACVLRPQSSASDTAIIADLSNNNKSNQINIYNKANQSIRYAARLYHHDILAGSQTDFLEGVARDEIRGGAKIAHSDGAALELLGSGDLAPAH